MDASTDARRARTLVHDRVPAQRRGATRAFLIEAVRDMRTVGAVAPSGRALAHALTAPVRAQGPRALTVLEAGAGTGAVTRALTAQLSPDSRLDVVEANPRFADRLRTLVQDGPGGRDGRDGPSGLDELGGPGGRRARQDDGRDGEGWRIRQGGRDHGPHPAGGPDRIRVHQSRVEELDTGRRYDVIVSGLPLTNFGPAQVETIMQRYLELLRPGGVLTYFAYLGTRPARGLLSTRAEARRHRAVDDIVAAYRSRYATGCRTVWANLPPARVWQLERPAAPAPLLPDALVTHAPPADSLAPGAPVTDALPLAPSDAPPFAPAPSDAAPLSPDPLSPAPVDAGPPVPAPRPAEGAR